MAGPTMAPRPLADNPRAAEPRHAARVRRRAPVTLLSAQPLFGRWPRMAASQPNHTPPALRMQWPITMRGVTVP
eukprot:4542157-Prymnesium_polylepis.2